MTKGQWQRFSPEFARDLPNEPAAFELGNLVRNTLYVGGRTGLTLRDCVIAALDDPDLARHARAIRFDVAADPSEEATALLGAYRSEHGGEIPPCQKAEATQPTAEAARAAAEKNVTELPDRPRRRRRRKRRGGDAGDQPIRTVA